QTVNTGYNMNMGFKFTPTAAASVTQLGGFYNGTKTVRLYDNPANWWNDTVIAQVTNTSANAFSYTPITPVALPAGALYGPPAATVEPTRIAVVNGEEIRALVPPQLRADPAAYQSFARQFVYRAALRQRALSQDVALTAAERAGVDATLPPLKSVQDMLRRQG